MLHLLIIKIGYVNMSTFRGFIAVDIKATENIIRFLNEINKINADIKTVDPKNIHITLKFLGDVQDEKIKPIKDIIKDAVKGISSFNLKLKSSGVFPNKNYIRVVWIGIQDSDNLKKIARNIDEEIFKLGFKKENRDFSAHLTLGRVKTAKNKDILLKKVEEYTDFDFGTQEVKSIKLKKSELTPSGPIYTTLEEIGF